MANIKRRDLLDASRLLAKHNLSKPGEMDTPALMLAVNYLQEKRDGETDLPFPEWLDEDFDASDLESGDDEDDAASTDPTDPTDAS
jgi:hypothetical protein